MPLNVGVIGVGYLAALAMLTLLSARTVLISRASAPWTCAGWLSTIGYDITESYEILAHVHLPLYAPYWFLAALTVAFVVAGVRDEPQGEPWWWPRALGLTRAQRRATAKKRA